MLKLISYLSITLALVLLSCQDPNANTTAMNGIWELSDYGYSQSIAQKYNQPASRAAYIAQKGCLSALLTIHTNNTATITNQCNHNAANSAEVDAAYTNRSIDYETMGAIPQGEDVRFYFYNNNTEVILNRQPTNQQAYVSFYRIYFSSDKQYMYWLTGDENQYSNDRTITWHKICPSGGCY